MANDRATICSPVTSQPNGPLKDSIAQISERLDVSPDQVLMAWAKAKGVVVVAWAPNISVTPWDLLSTHVSRSSSKVSRLKGYIAAGDISRTDFSKYNDSFDWILLPALTEEDIKTLDGGASSKFTLNGLSVRTVAGRAAVLALAGAVVIGMRAYLGLDAI